MANGPGSKISSRANWQVGEYIFKMNDSSASSHALDDRDSGKTFLLHSTVARTITLPSPKGGVSYKFIVSDSTAASTIAATGNLIKGGILLNTAWETLAGTTLTQSTNAVVGDWIALVSDGTNWYISGQSGHINGFTIA